MKNTRWATLLTPRQVCEGERASERASERESAREYTGAYWCVCVCMPKLCMRVMPLCTLRCVGMGIQGAGTEPQRHFVVLCHNITQGLLLIQAQRPVALRDDSCQ